MRTRKHVPVRQGSLNTCPCAHLSTLHPIYPEPHPPSPTPSALKNHPRGRENVHLAATYAFMPTWSTELMFFPIPPCTHKMQLLIVAAIGNHSNRTFSCRHACGGERLSVGHCWRRGSGTDMEGMQDKLLPRQRDTHGTARVCARASACSVGYTTKEDPRK